MNLNCIICTELFKSSDSAFTTNCGHIFHHACLIQWFERSKSCPQCRAKCTEKNIFRVYFNISNSLDTSIQNPQNLIEQIDNLNLQLREKDLMIRKRGEEVKKLQDKVTTSDQKITKLKVSNTHNEQLVHQMRHEINIFTTKNSQYKQLEIENNELKSKCKMLSSVEHVLLASQTEIDEMLRGEHSMQELRTMVGALKRELNQNELKKIELKKHLNLIKTELKTERIEKRNLMEKLSEFESENYSKVNEPKRARIEEFLTTPSPKKIQLENVKKEKDSEVPTRTNSPYFSVVKTGGLAISSALKLPNALGVKQDKVTTTGLYRTKSLTNPSSNAFQGIQNFDAKRKLVGVSSDTNGLKKLSIFNNKKF